MTANELASMLGKRAEEVCKKLLPNGVRNGKEWCVGSLSGEAGESLRVCVEGEKSGVWADFATQGEAGDLIGLWQKARGLELPDACREAEEFLGVSGESPAHEPAQAAKRIETKPPSESWKRLQERLRKGTVAEIQALAELRKIPNTAGLELASQAGQLFFADVWDAGFEHPAWIITDSGRINAQARRMDGKPWDGIGGIKCKTISGCPAKWPVGIHGVNGKDIAFVEGSPDLLAAWHYIWLHGVKDKITPVAMFGSFDIHPDAVPLFNGKRIFAFPHNDPDGKGERTMDGWEKQLKGAAGFQRFDFKSTGKKDLNELVEIAGGSDESGALPAPIKDMFENSKRMAVIRNLDTRRVSIAKTPPEPVTRLFLAKKPIATPGNIVTLIAKAKTGKTAALGGVVAAMIAAMTGRTDLDTLGFTASNPSGHAVLVFDTEQSLYDAFLCYQRALNRAESQSDPEWLYHYALVGYSAGEIKEAITIACDVVSKRHGGVFCVVIDGVADLALSVNDEAEAKTIVTYLRALSVQHDCPIATVIHSNEAIKSGDDGRGHLGKELMRKAESNLLLRKSGEVTLITSEKQRKAPITEEDGIAFKWSNAEQRHVTCLSGSNAKDEAKKDKLREIADAVFEHLGRLSARYGEMVKAIGDVRKIGPSAAEDRFSDMKKLGVIEKDLVGLWRIKT